MKVNGAQKYTNLEILHHTGGSERIVAIYYYYYYFKINFRLVHSLKICY